jgi:hypothetical protein
MTGQVAVPVAGGVGVSVDVERLAADSSEIREQDD